MDPTALPPPLRVLVVDDCPDTTATMAILLRLWGHQVWVAHDGLSALAAARACRPDVVLLDVGLPGMTGWELARHLRHLPGLERALLVAVTGYGSAEEQARRVCQILPCAPRS